MSGPLPNAAADRWSEVGRLPLFRGGISPTAHHPNSRRPAERLARQIYSVASKLARLLQIFHGSVVGGATGAAAPCAPLRVE